MKKLIPALALMPLLALGADGTPDDSFYENAAQGGHAEVELGKLAQEKATSPAVKEFGAMMVKDHTAANQKLMALAKTKGIELPMKPNMAQSAKKTAMQALSGDTFDKQFMRSMVDDHEDTIELFEKQAKDGKDAEAKALAASTLPTLRAHLKQAQVVAMKVGAKD